MRSKRLINTCAIIWVIKTMSKIIVIDCPIRCPDYHEGTCFNRDKSNPSSNQWPPCEWYQGMENTFPEDCPLKDAPQDEQAHQ
jgi:hypothetical protein